MITVAASGITITLGGLLLAAGVLKLWHPNPFGWALLRLLPIGWPGWQVVRPIRVARAVGLVEVTTGFAVVAADGSLGKVMAFFTAITFVAFTGVVAIAVRKGVGCGCWASLSDGPATGGEIGRALFLAASAVGLVVLRLAGDSKTEWSPGAAGFAIGLVISVWVAMRLGAMLRPGQTKAIVRGPLGSGSQLIREAALLTGMIGHRSGHRPLPRVPTAR